MGNTRITEDPRIDPRIKAVVGAIDLGLAVSDAESREQVLKEANTEQAIAVRDLVTWGRHRRSLSFGAPESDLSCHRAPQPPERQASKVTATTIPIKIRRFATKSCSRIGLAWRLAPAEMDHPHGDNGDHSRDPALDEDGHRAHRDDVRLRP